MQLLVVEEEKLSEEEIRESNEFLFYFVVLTHSTVVQSTAKRWKTLKIKLIFKNCSDQWRFMNYHFVNERNIKYDETSPLVFQPYERKEMIIKIKVIVSPYIDMLLNETFTVEVVCSMTDFEGGQQENQYIQISIKVSEHAANKYSITSNVLLLQSQDVEVDHLQNIEQQDQEILLPIIQLQQEQVEGSDNDIAACLNL
jgi:hypothetical protein